MKADEQYNELFKILFKLDDELQDLGYRNDWGQERTPFFCTEVCVATLLLLASMGGQRVISNAITWLESARVPRV